MNKDARAFFTKVFLLVLLVAVSFVSGKAQSSVVVSNEGNNAVVTVRNFPKNATILIIDDNLNLLFVTATDAAGAASVLLPHYTRNSVTARTVHGDYEASHKVEVRQIATSNNAEADKTNNPAKT
jgi:hypothetical protein